PFGSRERALQGSVDNEYVYLADQWGWVALGGLLLMVAVAVWTALRTRGPPPTLAIPAVTVGNLVGLSFVALITQQQVLVWILLGATGAVAAARRREEPAL